MRNASKIKSGAFEICSPLKCTGCGACLNVCPATAIRFSENEYGELHPLVDLGKCTFCGLCKKVCPNNNARNFYAPAHCYASWILNKENRAECASGGVATALSECVINEKGGVVFGTAYDALMTPRVTWTDTVAGLEKFKGSKYVKSIVESDTLKKVSEFLKQNRTVLFIGTPCQIAGLISYLGDSPNNLLTVDLLCHGVCPVKYFHEELKCQVKRFKIDKIENVRFRGNDDGCGKVGFFDRMMGRKDSNNFRLSIWDRDDNGKIRLRYRGEGTENYYLAGFLKGVTLRENCYSCPYARPDRVADVTLGDFIGLGKDSLFDHPTDNVSVVLTNTEKGCKFYGHVADNKEKMLSVERPFSERLAYPHSLVSPFPRHRLCEKFRLLYRKMGYRRAIVKVLRRTLFCERVIVLLSYCKGVLKSLLVQLTVKALRVKTTRAIGGKMT